MMIRSKLRKPDFAHPNHHAEDTMKIIPINFGLPRRAIWNGQPISTRIFKSPVEGCVKLRTLNLEGDR
jgi:hypothetical protein